MGSPAISDYLIGVRTEGIMKLLWNWISVALKAIGADASSLRKMNLPFKVVGVLLIVTFALAVISEVSKSPEEKVAVSAANQQKLEQNVLADPTVSKERGRSISPVFGWIGLGCFAIALFMEPKEPKRDGRFRTGFKNNATVRKKSTGESRAQIYLIVIGLISVAINFFAG
jgi:hypothetical protein